MEARGKVSHFGGPEDTGVQPDEGLAFIFEVEQAPHLFLSYQPEGTTGLARRLNPETQYVACRWDYNLTPKAMLLEEMALVRNVKTGKEIKCYPADWGPHSDTNRIADVSPSVMEILGLQTDDEVVVIFPYTTRGSINYGYNRVVISSGHGKYVRGASGVLDEVTEARDVVDAVAEKLRYRDVECIVFHDDTSHTQSENLDTIVSFHNDQDRELDVSIHFNAYVETTSPMGTECLYVTQDALAETVAGAISACGFINRGAKRRTDLYFLNQTTGPSILIEVCFVDSSADANVYNERFDAICEAIAAVLGGPAIAEEVVIEQGEE